MTQSEFKYHPALKGYLFNSESMHASSYKLHLNSLNVFARILKGTLRSQWELIIIMIATEVSNKEMVHTIIKCDFIAVSKVLNITVNNCDKSFLTSAELKQ